MLVSRVLHSPLKRPALLALGLTLVLSLMFLAPRPGKALAAVAPAGKTIDWAHPTRVQPLPTGVRSGLASALAPNVVPEPVSSSVSQLQPNANFPTNCLNNYAYYIGYNGQFIWTTTHGSVESWVAYMWCPRWQGDRIGINWAYGRDYALSGCKTMLIGNHRSSGLGWYGAAIIGTYSANDGETNSTYTVCNSYAWDDSLTVPGNGKYSVFMLFKDTVGDQFNAQSPTF
jgi:hypothetical protein